MSCVFVNTSDINIFRKREGEEGEGGRERVLQVRILQVGKK